MKKHYYTYRITCTQGSYNGKVYFGKRTTTKNPNEDKYKGSGKLLKDYYQKY